MLYALLFLVAGLSLLALTYTLLASRLPAPPVPAPSQLLKACKQEQAHVPKSKQAQPHAPSPKQAQASATVLLDKCKQAYLAGARTGAQDQRQHTLNSLLLASGIGLAVITIASAGLGWLLAGRALRPVRRITETARRASELHLGERIALTGPDDELKELGDTFDDMLERLDQAFATQKRFVANAAHELRTPLTAMRTSLEVTLAKPNRTPEQLEAMAAKIKRAIYRAEATVDALLTLATSERGPAANEPLDLATAAENALDSASPRIQSQNLTVDARLESAPTSGDPILLERMIANLVDNAARHNVPHGWVRVRTGHSNGSVTFQIANSGPYVPEEMIPGLFEPFGRLEQRLNPEEGVGLGLSIARAIGVAHGAALVARSRPDGGLEVSVTIPSIDEHEPTQ